MLEKLRVLLIHESHGIVIVTGPTGSGKSTTLYAAPVAHHERQAQHQHHRGPGRAAPDRCQPVPGQQPGWVHLPPGAALPAAPGPGRDHGRRGPRPRDRQARHRSRADRAPRAHHAPHQRRPHRRPPAKSTWGSSRTSSPPRSGVSSPSGWYAASAPTARRETGLDPVQAQALAQICGGSSPVTSQFIGAGCPQCRDTGFSGRVGVFELLVLKRAHPLGDRARPDHGRGPPDPRCPEHPALATGSTRSAKV